MNLSRFCRTKLVELNLKSNTKDEILVEIAKLIAKSPSITDKDVVLKDLLLREKLGSTGVGMGIAFPHARSQGVKALTIAFARSFNAIDYDSIDKKPVKLFFIVVSPEAMHTQHLQVLAKLSLIMHDKNNFQRAMDAEYPQEILDLIDQK